jgi:hypothetical protein
VTGGEQPRGIDQNVDGADAGKGRVDGGGLRNVDHDGTGG